jgi:broad specificity phosphatase PhoE
MVSVGFAVRRFLVVRHGETEWNRMGRRQGQLDSPLTEDGWRHAETVADLCAALGADSVFSSPLGRARATADVVGSRLSLPVVVISDLAEIDHGAFAGLTNDEIEARHPGELARRAQSRYTWSFPGGESYADADVRAGAALDAVAATGATSPVLVTHEMIGRMLLRTLLRLDPQDALERSLPHGSVIEVWPADARASTHTM